MLLSYEHVGSKIPAKINTHMLTRAELLITLCYEIPCNKRHGSLVSNRQHQGQTIHPAKNLFQCISTKFFVW